MTMRYRPASVYVGGLLTFSRRGAGAPDFSTTQS